ASEYGRGDVSRAARAAAYLRDNVKYGLGPDEAAGLQLFLNYAADLGLAPRRRQLEFFWAWRWEGRLRWNQPPAEPAPQSFLVEALWIAVVWAGFRDGNEPSARTR